MAFTNFIEELRQLVVQGQLEEAFGKIEKSYMNFRSIKLRRECMSLCGRYFQYLEKERQGEGNSSEKNKINNDLIKMLLEYDPEDFEPLLDESKIEKGENKQKENSLKDYSIHHCDRTTQEDEFIRYNDEYIKYKKNNRFRFFCIHGEDVQVPDSLFKRFYNDLDRRLAVETIEREIILGDALDLESYKLKICYKLLEAFNIEQGMKSSLDEFQFHKLASVINHQNPKAKLVAIQIKIDSPYWKSFTVDFLKWFMADFCGLPKENETNIDAYPWFYFFFTITYEDFEENNDGINWKSKIQRSKKSKDPFDEIKNGLFELKEDKSVYVLTELSPVTRKDIDNWIKENLKNSEIDKIDRRKIIDRYFPKKKFSLFGKSNSIDMIIVQRKLKKIIEAYNNNELYG